MFLSTNEPHPNETYKEFADKLALMTSLVARAALSNYQLRHKNYRKIYLRHRRKLLSALLNLRDLADGSRLSNIVQRITDKLNPVFQIETDTQDKRKALDSIGSALEELEKEVSKIAERELILLDDRPYEAFRKILAKIDRAKKYVMISDPWVDESIFQLYLEKVPTGVLIQVLTKNMPANFKIIAAKFSNQHKKFELRKLSQLHDRHLVVDDRVWFLGQSIKDAGDKPLSIVEIRDVSAAKKVLQDLWNRAQKII
jgi:phosphatidylserine/phosphatidylglycerophosphate/cardiolipin synthase-like enzyme